MPISQYNHLFNLHSDSLKNTSEDNGNFMTSCQNDVINFDEVAKVCPYKFRNCIPKSCDALYMDNNNELYLIEFKNGHINELVKKDVDIKVCESLLLFFHIFNQDILFSKSKMHFILVYNASVNRRASISRAIYQRASNTPIRFKLHRHLMYFKDVQTYNEQEFQKHFVVNM